jgi:hypothetical protein
MTASSEPVIDGGPPPPDLTTLLEVPGDAMDTTVETGKKTDEYRIVFEFFLPTQQKGRQANAISEKVTKIIKKMQEEVEDATIRTENDTIITEDNLEKHDKKMMKLFNVRFNERGLRTKYLFDIKMTTCEVTSYRMLKSFLLKWLKDEQIHMWNHVYKNKTIELSKVGTLIQNIPEATFLPGLEHQINDHMAKAWNNFSSDEKSNAAKNNEDNNVPEVRLQNAWTNWALGTRTVRIFAINVECANSVKRIVKELMIKLFPVSKGDPMFVPSSMPHDQTIPNAKEKYFTILHLQNQFVQTHDYFTLSGVSEAAMTSKLDSGKTLFDTILEHPSIISIAKTFSTNERGTWTIISPTDKVHLATTFLDEKLATLVLQTGAPPPPNFNSPPQRHLVQSSATQQHMTALSAVGTKSVKISANVSYASPSPKRWSTNANQVPTSIRRASDTRSHDSSLSDTKFTQITAEISELTSKMTQMSTLIETFASAQKSHVENLEQRMAIHEQSTKAQVQSLTDHMENMMSRLITALENNNSPAPTAPIDPVTIGNTIAHAVATQLSHSLPQAFNSFMNAAPDSQSYVYGPPPPQVFPHPAAPGYHPHPATNYNGTYPPSPQFQPLPHDPYYVPPFSTPTNRLHPDTPTVIASPPNHGTPYATTPSISSTTSMQTTSPEYHFSPNDSSPQRRSITAVEQPPRQLASDFEEVNDAPTSPSAPTKPPNRRL